MGPNESRPSCRALALGRGRQSVPLQDIADGLIADLVSQIGQRPRNPVITPVTVLLGHAKDQLLNLSLDPRPAGASTGLRAIECAGDELAVPGQDGVRLRHIGYLAENLAAQSMTDLAERGSLGVRELQLSFQLGLQDPIFGGQIFVPRQQLLVHHPCDEGQDARPMHSSSTPADSRLTAPKKNRSQRHPARLRREWTIHRLFYSFNFLTIRHPRQAHCPRLALAERLRRKIDQINPPRVCRPYCRLGRSALTPDSDEVCRLL